VAHGRPFGFGEIRDPVIRRVGLHDPEEIRDPAENERVGQPNQRFGHDSHPSVRVHAVQPLEFLRLYLVHDLLHGEIVQHAAVEYSAQIFAVLVAIAVHAKQFARHDFTHHRDGELFYPPQRDFGRRGDAAGRGLVDTFVRAP